MSLLHHVDGLCASITLSRNWSAQVNLFLHCPQINPPMGTVEAGPGAEWWAANVGQDVSDKCPPPTQAAGAHDGGEAAHPRKQFEENLLRQVRRPRLPKHPA